MNAVNAGLEILLFCMACSSWFAAVRIGRTSTTMLEGALSLAAYAFGAGCFLLMLEGLYL